MHIMATDLVLSTTAHIGYDPYNSVASFDDAVMRMHCSHDDEYIEVLHDAEFARQRIAEVE